MIKTLIISFLAGVGGTTIGAAILCFTKIKKTKTLGYITSFASGFMIAVVCFDLIPEALEISNMLVLFAGCFVGIATIIVVNHFATPKKTLRNEQSEYLNMGILMLISIALHNFPEGMAIGSMGIIHNSISIGLLIAIHNVPEGMAIAIPLLKSGMGKFKTIMLAAVSGIPTVFGALFGYLVGNLSNHIIALCLGFASGAMLFVVYEEMNVESYKLAKPRDIGLFNIIGILFGVALISFL